MGWINARYRRFSVGREEPASGLFCEGGGSRLPERSTTPHPPIYSRKERKRSKLFMFVLCPHCSDEKDADLEGEKQESRGLFRSMTRVEQGTEKRKGCRSHCRSKHIGSFRRELGNKRRRATLPAL
ncbi:hypothetical protein BHM03_00052184 [Ensete ventricosum]|nr:hypothetical protein BHM03_00052184 [Ensete ventricosum]